MKRIIRFALVLSTAGLLAGVTHAAPTPAPKAPEPAEDSPVLKGPADKPAIEVKRARGAVGTVVFIHGATGAPGAQFTRVVAMTSPGPKGMPADLGYDKFLGPLTMKSLGQVMQAMVAMHHGWPQGQKLQLVFADKPTPAELQPATLAEALALDSTFRDYDIEPSYAAIGSLQEDGSIDAVGSMAERLGGAARARVARIVVPEKNRQQVSDYLLSEGIGAFVGTQIFTASNFNEAGVLALTKLDPKTQEVVTLFGSVQRTLYHAQAGAVGLLQSDRVQGVLQKVLEAAPNHCSAQILLDWGTGKKITIGFDGSVDVIDRRAADLIRAMRAKQPEALKTPRDKVAADLAALKFVSERLHPLARPYAAALMRFGDALQKGIGTSSRPPARLTGAAEQAFEKAKQEGNDEWAKMVQARQTLAEPPKQP